MSIATAIRTQLVDNATVFAIVGEKISLVQAGKGDALPYIFITRISGGHTHHMTGSGQLVTSTYQLSCWQTSPILAYVLADAVRNTLDTFRGELGSGDETATVRMCHLVDETDLFDNQSGDDMAGARGTKETAAFGVAMTFDLAHTELEPVLY